MAYTLSLNHLLNLKKNITTEYISRFMIEHRSKNTDNFTAYIKNMKNQIERNISIKNKKRFSFKKYNIFRSHKIYNVDLLITGHKAYGIFNIDIDYMTIEDILHCLYIIYKNSCELHCVKTIRVEHIYILMCILIYEFIPFNTFIIDFALTRFTHISNKSIRFMTKELQHRYVKTHDMSYIYMINILLRGWSRSFINWYFTVRKQFKLHKYSEILNIDINEFLYKYEPPKTRHNKETQDKKNGYITLAHQCIAEMTMENEVYSVVHGKIPPLYKLNTKLFHKQIMDDLNEFNSDVMAVIHVSNLN